MSKPNIYDESFSERMKFITEKNFQNNYSKFARAVGVTQPSLVRWIKGEADPTRTNLMKIASATGVSIEWLMLGTDTSATNETHPNEYNENTEDNELMDEYDFIIGYNVQAAAGNGIINGDAKPSRKLAFRKRWLHYRRFNAKDLVLIWAKGDSMYPTIQDNDTLVVNTVRKTPIDGRIYVIRRDAELLVKRVQLIPSGLRLISDNKDMYAPVDLVESDLLNFEVVGQVVHVTHDFPD